MTIKKNLSLILLFFISASIFIPTTQAVQLFGDDVTYNTRFTLPDVVENGGKVLYSFRQNSDIPFSSLACFDGHDEMGSCTRYAATVTPFFFVNLKDPDTNSMIKYNFGDLSLVFRINSTLTNAENSEYVYFTYNSFQGNGFGGNVTEGSLAKVPKTQCGSKNPDYCFVGFHVYMYMTPGDGGAVYLSSIDMIKYSDENDNMLFYKRDMEKGDPKNFFHQLSVWMGGNSAYGKKLGHIGDNGIIASGQDENRETIYLVLDNKFSWKKIISGQNFPYFRKGVHLTDSRRAYGLVIHSYEQLKNYDASTTHIRDFLVGTNNNLQGNLPAYFGAKGIDGGVVNNNTGEVEKDPNVYNDAEFNKTCGSDIGCHIKNLTISIGKFFGNIWNGFADIVKGIFTWLYESIKNFPPIKWAIEKFQPMLVVLWDYFISYFTPIWDIFTGKTNLQNIAWGNQEYICSKEPSRFIIENTTPAGKKPMEALGAFLYFINPLPPPEGTEICTGLGMKRIEYGKSTILDVMLFNIFVFAGIWFAFIGLRHYN